MVHLQAGMKPYSIPCLIAGLAVLFPVYSEPPFSYYGLLRILVTAASAWTAYWLVKEGRPNLAWLFVSIACLFNPFAKVEMVRETWRILDAATGLIMLWVVSVPVLTYLKADHQESAKLSRKVLPVLHLVFVVAACSAAAYYAYRDTELESQTRGMEKTIADQEAKIRDQDKRISDFRAGIEEAKGYMTDTQSYVTGLESQVSDLLGQVASLSAQNARLSAKPSAASVQGFWRIGDTKERVVAIQGTPSRIEAYGISGSRLYWSGASVKFDADQKAVEYSNYDNTLKVRL